MIRKIRNEKGITLVELLAAITIGGILMVLIMSIFSNGQNQYSSQTTKAEQLNDLRYAAKVITKEIRKADKVVVDSTSLTLGTDSPVVFTFDSLNNEILKNGTTLVSSIEDFSFLPVSENEDEKFKDNLTLEIKIIGFEEKGQGQNFETVIFIRKGVVIEKK